MQPRQPPARPLVWVALAVFAGAWAVDPGFSPSALLVLPGLLALARGSGPRPGLLALVLLAAAGAGRAALSQRTDALARPSVGRWEPRAPDATRGALEGSGGPSRDLGPAGPRAGELVRLLPPVRVLAPARAPGDPEVSGDDGALLADQAPDEIQRLAPAPPAGALQRLAAGLRKRVAERVQRSLDPNAAALARALLLGDSSALGAETRDLFTRTGTRHLLAVSGLHVALFALVCLRPFLRALAVALGGGDRSVAVLLALAMLVYVPLSGGRAPVARAGLALAISLAGPLVAPPGGPSPARRPDGPSLLAAALLLECVLDARAPARVAVQLSYGATAGLLVATGPLMRALPGPRSGARPDSSLLRPLLLGAARPFVRGLAASAAATLATLPAVWTHFGEWSPIGIVATPLLVPLLACVLVLAWLLVLGLPGAPAAFQAVSGAMTATLAALDHLPATPVPLPPRPAGLLAGIALLALAGLRREPRQRWAGRAAALLAASTLLPWTAAPRGLEIELLDVGHGTAVLARAPGSVWILDGGTRDRRALASAMARRLAAWEARRPIYVLTHDDSDHASALPHLASRFPPRLWAGALPRGERFPHGTLRTDVSAGRLRLPSEGPVEAFLARGLDRPGNEGSRSLSLRSRRGWVHLLGDAEDAGLAAVLRRGHLPRPCALLLVPHHGSEGPASVALLDSLLPARTWISCSGEAPLERELLRRAIPMHATGRSGPASWCDGAKLAREVLSSGNPRGSRPGPPRGRAP